MSPNLNPETDPETLKYLQSAAEKAMWKYRESELNREAERQEAERLRWVRAKEHPQE